MGYHFKRIILPPGNNLEKVIKLVKAFRAKSSRNCTFIYSDFNGKKYRKSYLKEATKIQLNFIELGTSLFAKEIIEITESTLGINNFLFREYDDDELDILYPNINWIKLNYPDNTVDWLLQPIEDIISLNEKTFYSIPRNPSFVGIECPLFVDLLNQVYPNQIHPCPICGFSYISKFSRRRCSKCGFGYIPFESRDKALTIKEIALDSFAYGSCSRCRKTWKFTNKIEQCFKCGQINKVIDGKFSHELVQNELEIHNVISKLRKTNGMNWRFWKRI